MGFFSLVQSPCPSKPLDHRRCGLSCHSGIYGVIATLALPFLPKVFLGFVNSVLFKPFNLSTTQKDFSTLLPNLLFCYLIYWLIMGINHFLGWNCCVCGVRGSITFQVVRKGRRIRRGLYCVRSMLGRILVVRDCNEYKIRGLGQVSRVKTMRNCIPILQHVGNG